MGRRRGDRAIRVRLQGRKEEFYSIRIGHDILSFLPAALAAVAPADRYFLVTDSNVERLHGRGFLRRLRQAGPPVHPLVVPAGERSKSRQVKARLEDRMLERGGSRDSALLALGGGMVCDLAGFTAATYHRGIPFVPIPTTLLAMVDAAIGGKTAVDHPRGKNLIGAFHQPRAVFADVRFLSTLPERELRSGLAEVVKSAVMGDSELFRRLEAAPAAVLSRHPDALVDLVSACVRVKVRVVEADERESNLRAALNFGHTIGHALEHLLDYRLTHGEAISIGMILEARAGEAAGIIQRGVAERIAALLERLRLPICLPKGVSPARVMEVARRDKKAEAGEIRYALPCTIGQMARSRGRYTLPLPDRLVLDVVRRPA